MSDPIQMQRTINAQAERIKELTEANKKLEAALAQATKPKKSTPKKK